MYFIPRRDEGAGAAGRAQGGERRFLANWRARVMARGLTWVTYQRRVLRGLGQLVHEAPQPAHTPLALERVGAPQRHVTVHRRREHAAACGGDSDPISNNLFLCSSTRFIFNND
jgi:hypothetical protein